MATWIIGLLVVGAVYLAAKVTLRAHRSGGCIGCSSCDKCAGHCTEIRNPKQAKPPACCGGKAK